MANYIGDQAAMIYRDKFRSQDNLLGYKPESIKETIAPAGSVHASSCSKFFVGLTKTQLLDCIYSGEGIYLSTLSGAWGEVDDGDVSIWTVLYSGQFELSLEKSSLLTYPPLLAATEEDMLVRVNEVIKMGGQPRQITSISGSEGHAPGKPDDFPALFTVLFQPAAAVEIRIQKADECKTENQSEELLAFTAFYEPPKLVVSESELSRKCVAAKKQFYCVYGAYPKDSSIVGPVEGPWSKVPEEGFPLYVEASWGVNGVSAGFCHKEPEEMTYHVQIDVD